MKKTLIILFLSLFVFGAKAQRIDKCTIYGVIYFETERKYANVIVFMEEDEYMANLVVFKEENKLFADGEGLWTITDTKAFADYIVYVDSDSRFADFTIYYADERSSAGCNL